MSMTPKARLHLLTQGYQRLAKETSKALNIIPAEGGFRQHAQAHIKELTRFSKELREWAISASDEPRSQ